MALKFVSITQPTEDSEEVGVSFQLDSEYTGKPPYFIGQAQVSIPLSEALEMTLAEIIGSARAQLKVRLIDCAK
ncbi:hypothetical protein ACWV16_26465 [Achromobacter xylosoxidans]|uniref:Uncharacterized protein n=1 Tax=Achromobacter ruhlandii TaxID=72557 RepID=A0A848ND81_9BURK|nr:MULTISPECIES: hypothetical protein [Achromobacter]MCZ8411669.1 hypothetical protein [Achromobacter dolens]NMU89067.1 hypothetical protein [Achromobacter ruhlandii]QKI79115.1 hypothetical protein HPS43_28980 [Achromobacter xylosoxidans]CCH09494.1 hypothetical protein NH44784_055511 [Achromobacter xylosoxidans NH44784-1996]